MARAAHIQDELRKLGPISTGQRNTLVAFGVTVALWLFPGVLAIAGLNDSAFARAYDLAVPESVAAMIGAILLFLLPVNWRARQFTLSWEQAVRIDWGIILLFGGGPGDGRARVLDRARRVDRPRHHGVAAGALDAVAHDPLHGRGDRDVRDSLEYRLGQHDRAGRDRRGAGVGHRSARTCARRDVRRLDGIHDADLDAAERDRLQLRPRADHAMMRHGIALDIAGFILIVVVVMGLGWVI